MSLATDWVDAYGRAWREGDAETCALLYTEDCVFRSHPSRDREDAREYMRRVIPEADAVDVWFGEPFERDRRAAVEYWAMLVEEPGGEKSTLMGCHLMRFDESGLVAEARDYWHLESGHRRPPPEWGR